MPVPTVEEQAIQLTATRRGSSGTPRHTPSSPSSGSRFSVLAEVPLEHLAQVAEDCGVVFRGERGPRLEQIATIQAKEIYEGALAASRAQAELVRTEPPNVGIPVETPIDRKSTRLNSSHITRSRMPSSA